MKRNKLTALIAVMAVAAMAMSLGCIGPTTIKDIKENPDYLGKEVTVEGTLTILGSMGSIWGDPGFVVRGRKKSLPGTYWEIHVKYRGALPIPNRVPGSKTKVRVTGIVRNEGYSWMPYIEATSWEYV